MGASASTRWVRDDADWLSVVDAAYGASKDVTAWTDVMFDAVRDFFDGLGAVVLALRHDESGRVCELTLRSHFAPVNDRSWIHLLTEPDDLREVFFPSTMVSSHAEQRAKGTPRARELFRSLRDNFGFEDNLGLLMHPMPGFLSSVGAIRDTESPILRDERRRLTWLGLHIEAALRLRLRPESLRAVVGPTGRIEHVTPDSPRPDELEHAVRCVREVRNRRHEGGDALRIWPALTAGELSVVQRVIGTRPHYFFFDNPPHRQPFTRLTAAEQDAVSAIARADTGKSAAYELGISESALSHRLAGVTEKLGLSSTMDLVRLGAMLAHDPRARFERIALTTSEQHILELVGRGLSNAEIARLRSRSARTIANQVASLLRKTQSPSRRALVARVATAHDDAR